MRIATVAFSVLVGVCAPGAVLAQTSFTSLVDVPTFDAIGPRAGTAGAAAPWTVGTERPNQTASDDDDDIKVSVYPILLWVPAFSARTTVPPFPPSGSSGGSGDPGDPSEPDVPGGSGSTEASFDGAALAGFSLEKANWRIDGDGIWAALVTRRDRPHLDIDLDIIYGHASGGVKIYKDLYVTGGIRRVALQYDIQIGDRPEHFVRKPGIWDPLVGLAYHSNPESRFVFHVTGEGGGFGVGADVDLSATVRADVKVFKHVGLTLGYNVLYLDLSDTVRDRTFEIKQTLHGPVMGLGLYF